MKTLSTTDCCQVSGGCGPGMFDGLFEGIACMFGIGIALSFAVGVASVYAYQYIRYSE